MQQDAGNTEATRGHPLTLRELQEEFTGSHYNNNLRLRQCPLCSLHFHVFLFEMHVQDCVEKSSRP